LGKEFKKKWVNPTNKYSAPEFTQSASPEGGKWQKNAWTRPSLDEMEDGEEVEKRKLENGKERSLYFYFSSFFILFYFHF
jgi:hypothetical protein